ncbi:hypothetical protein ACP4OV_019112 [Aristida adscensionis]
MNPTHLGFPALASSLHGIFFQPLFPKAPSQGAHTAASAGASAATTTAVGFAPTPEVPVVAAVEYMAGVSAASTARLARGIHSGPLNIRSGSGGVIDGWICGGGATAFTVMVAFDIDDGYVDERWRKRSRRRGGTNGRHGGDGGRTRHNSADGRRGGDSIRMRHREWVECGWGWNLL